MTDDLMNAFRLNVLNDFLGCGNGMGCLPNAHACMHEWMVGWLDGFPQRMNEWNSEHYLSNRIPKMSTPTMYQSTMPTEWNQQQHQQRQLNRV